MRPARALRISLCAVAFVMLSVAASQVSAQTTLTYNIGAPSSGVSAFPGTYATVNVNLTSSTQATITFTTLPFSNPQNAYLMGDGGAAAVNVNATTWTVTNISASNSLSGFTPGPFSDGGASNQDGFGSFNQNLNGTPGTGNGFTNSADTITFTLTNTGGTWADAGSVLTNNAKGWLASIHLFVCDNPASSCTASSAASVTGYGANSGVVPEPASMLLFGSGLVAIGIRLRRKARKNEVAA